MRLSVAALLVLAVFPAAATSTMCMFYAPPGAPVAGLEFLGHDELDDILINGKDGPRIFPTESYRVLAFDQRTKRIDLTFKNPGDPSLPSSFTLKGKGRDTRLTIQGKTYTGEMECGQW